jgi:hypothetical protein
MQPTSQVGRFGKLETSIKIWSKSMLKAPVLAAFVAIVAGGPALAQDAADKGKMWCTDAHMKQMEASIAKMTDAAMKKEAQSHLKMSEDAMKAKDTAGCVKHMEEAHKAMGL